MKESTGSKRRKRILAAGFILCAVTPFGAHTPAPFQAAAQNPDAMGSARPQAQLPDLSGEHAFDGIDIARYAEFWKTWHLLTVRYRKDNGEQRFVYANDIAYKAQKAGAAVYPDGAMFGKIAFRTQEDEAFPSSMQPKGFTRVQLMKKDAAAYPQTNGWGYALYAAGTGVPYAEERTIVASCHACHQIVPQRDFVFSRSAFDDAHGSAEDDLTFYKRFSPTTFSEMGESSRNAVAAAGPPVPSDAAVKVLSLPLFAGSINESIGPLVQYARKDKTPFLMIDPDSDFFITAVPTLAGPASCPDEVRLARRMHLHTRAAAGDTIQSVILRGTACLDGVKWDLRKRPLK